MLEPKKILEIEYGKVTFITENKEFRYLFKKDFNNNIKK